MTAGKLLEQCRIVAERVGGAVAQSFLDTDRDGYQVAQQQPQRPPSPATKVGRRRHSVSHSRSRSRRRSSTKPERRKFEKVTQQGGEGSQNEFEMLSEERYMTIIAEYEQKLGTEIPPSEKPSIAQLSAFRWLVMTEGPLAVCFAVWGPFQERGANSSRLDDQVVNGMVVRRRATGPPTLVEWNPCWAIFAN